jgi:hypothetical protein
MERMGKGWAFGNRVGVHGALLRGDFGDRLEMLEDPFFGIEQQVPHRGFAAVRNDNTL